MGWKQSNPDPPPYLQSPTGSTLANFLFLCSGSNGISEQIFTGWAGPVKCQSLVAFGISELHNKCFLSTSLDFRKGENNFFHQTQHSPKSYNLLLSQFSKYKAWGAGGDSEFFIPFKRSHSKKTSSHCWGLLSNMSWLQLVLLPRVLGRSNSLGTIGENIPLLSYLL